MTRWMLVSGAGAGAARGGAGVVAGGRCAPISCAAAMRGAATDAASTNSANVSAARRLRSVPPSEEVASMRNLVILILVLGCAGATPRASAPELPVAGGYKGPFNNDDQGHADFCVRMTVPS